MRASCIVGVVPLGTSGLERTSGWSHGSRERQGVRLGIAGEEALAVELEREHAKIRESVAADPTNVLGDFELSESDRATLARPEVMQIVRESTAEQALNGVWGWVDDDLAIVAAWGFDVSEVSVPVLVVRRDRRARPPAHGEWLAANVPGSQVKIDDFAGHLASDPVQDISENILWLRDGTPPPGSRNGA